MNEANRRLASEGEDGWRRKQTYDFYQEQWTGNESNDGGFNSIGGVTKDANTRNNGVGV